MIGLKSGAGNYKTIQEAVDSVSDYNTHEPVIIQNREETFPQVCVSEGQMIYGKTWVIINFSMELWHFYSWLMHTNKRLNAGLPKL